MRIKLKVMSIFAYFFRYTVLRNLYVPDSSVVFPPRDDYKKLRRFVYLWLTEYSPWLVYSKSQNGGLCLCCVLFTNSRSKATAGVLVNAPLIKFYKAKELLQKHSTEINFHKGAMADMRHIFIAIMEQCRPSVIHLANSAHSSVVEKKSICT